LGRALSVHLTDARRGGHARPPRLRDVEAIMPARSKAQQKAAGAALSAKRGETKTSALKGASREMYDSMSETQLEELAETSRKGKPEHVADR